MKHYIGIDPGVSGALAFYSVPSERGELPALRLIDFRIKKPGAARTFRKFTQLQATMETIASEIGILTETLGKPECALIETPASMPGEGVVSAFTFGKNCGCIEGILYGMGIKTFHTVPAVWKSQLGLSSDKKKSIAKAIELFSNVYVDGGLEKFQKPVRMADGRAEAAILAWAAAHKYGDKL